MLVGDRFRNTVYKAVSHLFELPMCQITNPLLGKYNKPNEMKYDESARYIAPI